jgi:clan AA aspartic protease (TIGR02281 family)
VKKGIWAMGRTGALLLLAAVAAPLLAGTLSRCTDAEGREVLTDTPGQFLLCTSADSEFPPDPPSVLSRPRPPAPLEAVTPPEPVDASLNRATDGAFVTVPLERIGGLLIVTVRLNQTRATKLIVDTGASHSLLSLKVAQELGLFSQPPVALVSLQTVGGSVQAEVVQIESIELAGAEVPHSWAAVHDMPDIPDGVEGLLGQSFLRQFEVTVNPTKGELRLRPIP